MKKFTLDKKMVAQVRYYETFYIISDPDGVRVFTGNDRKTAERVLRVLNGVTARRLAAKKKVNKNPRRRQK